MKKWAISLCLPLCLICFAGTSYATLIDHNGSSITYNTSWDNPSVNVEAVLNSLYGSSTTLTLVNGITNEIEKWNGVGALSIMLEEIAGYKNSTEFGWYNTDNSSYGEIFDGPVSPGDSAATASITFANPTNFGFYIDPNGVESNRMFTEHLLNSDDDYQVTIWQVNGSQTDYILGWEDLDLNGGTGGDRDYQDMIVSLKINTANPAPEPATLLLLGTGLIGLAGWSRRKINKIN